MFKSSHVTLACSISLAANLACAGPLDLLFGGEAKPAAVTAAAPVSVKRLGDAEMSCERLYAEVNQLEALVAKSQADTQAQSSSEAGKQVVSGLAQGLLSAAPLFGGGRGGMIAGMVASQTATNQAQQSAQQRAQQGLADAATASQRREHLVNLFEQKPCKVSDLKK